MIIWMPYSLFDKLSSTLSSSTLLLQSHAAVIHVECGFLAEISQALLDSSLSTVLKLVYTLTGNFIWFIKLQAVEHNCSAACYANT